MLIMILIMVIKDAHTYGYMVPEDSCINLYPVHNASNQLSIPPVEILVSKNIYHPNETIKGKIF